jgi:hypothetical protein
MTRVFFREFHRGKQCFLEVAEEGADVSLFQLAPEETDGNDWKPIFADSSICPLTTAARPGT